MLTVAAEADNILKFFFFYFSEKTVQDMIFKWVIS